MELTSMFLILVAWRTALAVPDAPLTSDLSRRAAELYGDYYISWTMERLSDSDGELLGLAIEAKLPPDTRAARTEKGYMVQVDTGSFKTWLTGEAVKIFHPNRPGKYWEGVKRRPNEDPVPCPKSELYNYSNGLVVSVFVFESIRRAWRYKHVPKITWDVGQAEFLSGTFTGASSTQTGDGVIGLDPKTALAFVEAFKGTKIKNVLPANPQQLYFDTAGLRLHLGTSNELDVKWFPLDSGQAVSQWTVSSGPVGQSAGMEGGLTLFYTGRHNIMMAKERVQKFFQQWQVGDSEGHAAKQTSAGEWLVRCDKETQYFEPLDVPVLTENFKIMPASIIGKTRYPDSSGQSWCVSLLQELRDAEVQSNGITAQLGLAWMHYQHVVFDPAGQRIGVKPR